MPLQTASLIDARGASADVQRQRGVVGARELNGARAAAQADALPGERLVQRGRLRRRRCGSARCWRPGRPAGSRPGSSSAAADPTAPTASPAATMRASSTLVSVSSVSSRPSASVRSPLRAGQVRHAEAGRPDRDARWAARARRRAPPRPRAPRSTCAGSVDDGRRRACAAAWPPTGGPARSGTGPSTSPHTSVTVPALLGELGGGLDAGQPAADHARPARRRARRPALRAAAARAPIRLWDRRIRPRRAPAGTAPVLPTA